MIGTTWRAAFRAAALAAALALGAVGAAPAEPAAGVYRNPVLWADYSDPDVIRDGDAYYLVASSFHFSPGLPVLKSYDLVHWTIVGHVLPKLGFAPEYDLPARPAGQPADAVRQGVGNRYGGGVWAPSIRHHGGLFYVYWPTPDEGIFMATARRPEGPWSAPVQVLAGPGLEDPCPFWDDDGSAWLIHSKVGAGPLILHRMSPDGKRVLDAGFAVFEDRKAFRALEGPKLYKRHGWYYIFAPFGGVASGSQAVFRSRSLKGPYEARVVLTKGATQVQGPHQGGWVETPKGDGWFLHFNWAAGFGRIDYLEPVSWIDDWPLIGDPIPGATAGQPVAEHAMPWTAPGRPRLQLQGSDGFSAPKLGLQWEWNHNPDDARWSLTERPGFLRLRSGPAPDLLGARNTLTQVLVGPSSTVTARLDVGRMVDGQRAGLAMFGRTSSWIGVAQAGGVRRIAVSDGHHETLGPELAGDAVELRLSAAADQSVAYAWRTPSGAFAPLGEPAHFHFDFWKGARPGLFTFNPESAASGGLVDVDWVHVERGEGAGG